jgi:hypothetical protein
VAFKDYGTRKSWYESAPEVDLKIKSRVRATVSGKPRLQSFDGSTMTKYQVPHSAFEEIYCRSPSHAKPVVECEHLRGYEADRPNADADMFQIRPRTGVSSSNGLGVHAKAHIPKGTMIMQEKSVHSISLLPSTWDHTMKTLNAAKNAKIGNDIKTVVDFAIYFGFETTLRGQVGYEIPSRLLSLVNNANESEELANPTFNPVIARRLSHLIRGYSILNRDIEAGEELLTSYLTNIDNPKREHAALVDEL